jgi:hypothetical protein
MVYPYALSPTLSTSSAMKTQENTEDVAAPEPAAEEHIKREFIYLLFIYSSNTPLISCAAQVQVQ